MKISESGQDRKSFITVHCQSLSSCLSTYIYLRWSKILSILFPHFSCLDHNRVLEKLFDHSEFLYIEGSEESLFLSLFHDSMADFCFRRNTAIILCWFTDEQAWKAVTQWTVKLQQHSLEKACNAKVPLLNQVFTGRLSCIIKAIFLPAKASGTTQKSHLLPTINSYRKQCRTEICLGYEQSLYIGADCFSLKIRMWHDNKIVTKEWFALIFLKIV